MTSRLLHTEIILIEWGFSSKKWLLLGDYQEQPPKVFYKELGTLKS